MGGEAPHLFEWVLRPPGPPRPRKSRISGRPKAHVLKTHNPTYKPPKIAPSSKYEGRGPATAHTGSTPAAHRLKTGPKPVKLHRSLCLSLLRAGLKAKIKIKIFGFGPESAQNLRSPWENGSPDPPPGPPGPREKIKIILSTARSLIAIKPRNNN